MTHVDALAILAKTDEVTRLRYLCSDDNPDVEVREAWQKKVVRKVEGTDKPCYPPIAKQAANHNENLNQNMNNNQLNHQPQQQPPSSAISGPGGSVHKIPLADSIRLTKAINSCPHHAKSTNCGCSMALCRAAKKGAPSPHETDGSTLVSWIDCALCLEPSNETIMKIAGLI